MYTMSITRSVSSLWYSQVDYVQSDYCCVPDNYVNGVWTDPRTYRSPALLTHCSYSRLARRIVETGADWTDRGMAGDGRTNERSYGT